MRLAIGFFDGVHLGHQRILAGADAALTFREHPLSVLAPDKAPPLLMTPEERLAAISSALKGDPSNFPTSQLPNFPPRVRALSFTRELAAEPADAFAARLRRDRRLAIVGGIVAVPFALAMFAAFVVFCAVM